MNDKLEEIFATLLCYLTIGGAISFFSYIIYLYLKL